MDTLARWDPFRELDDLQKRLGTLYRRAPVRQEGKEEALTVAEWVPVVDITEDDTEYVIKAELPDVKREDVKVTVEDGVLSLSGERTFQKEEKGKRYHRVERAYGRFLRTFTVPDDAEGSQVMAAFKDGMLAVHLPKSPTATPKRIEVKVG